MNTNATFLFDLLPEAQASQTLQGQVSERTRLSKMSIVDDVDFEHRGDAKRC